MFVNKSSLLITACSGRTNRMNDAFIYQFIVYYCRPKALYNHVGGSLLNHHQCAASTWMMRRLPQDNGASALTTHQVQVERRESDRANQVDGDY